MPIGDLPYNSGSIMINDSGRVRQFGGNGRCPEMVTVPTINLPHASIFQRRPSLINQVNHVEAATPKDQIGEGANTP